MTTNYYDGKGRVATITGGRLLAEYDQSGVCVKDYIYMGSKLLAEYQPSGSQYYYYTSDQINSTRIVTDSTGAIVSSSLYDPYGGVQKVWIDTYHPKLGFSGKERESSSELDYFGARYYGHKQYRFLSVDPVINKDEAIANPQRWNLYAYCSNNPITRFDPDGRVDGNNWQDQMPNGGGWQQVDGKEFRQVMKGPLMVAGAIAAAGVTIAAGPAVWGTALTVMAKNPIAIQNILSGISGLAITGPPDPNSAGYGGFVASIIANWKEYGPGLKQTVADVGKGLDYVSNHIASDVAKFKNDATQFIMPKSYGPNYRGQ